jgi:kumamolisin
MNYSVLAGTERALPSGVRVVGPANRATTVQVTFHLRPSRDPSNEQLNAFVSRLIGQGLSERAHLSREQYASTFGVSTEDVQKVKQFARQFGLKVVHDLVVARTQSSNLAHRTVEVRGRIGDFNRALQTKVVEVRDAKGLHRTYTGALSVPEQVHGLIVNVLGLDNRPQVKPHFRPAHSLGSGSGGNDLPHYFPNEVANVYRFPASVTGRGQTIALMEFGGGARVRDLRKYFKLLGIKKPATRFIPVGPGRNAPTGNPNSADGEVMLDAEVAGAVAPGAQIAFYFAPNRNRYFFRAVNAAVHDNVIKPSIISISWGGPEDSWTASDMQSLNESFQAAAAMGLSVFVAAGDAGSTDGVKGRLAHVDFPGSSPYVTCCGGTRLISSGGHITETVWNDGPNNGTGGGVSAVFPPALPYQRNILMTAPQRLTSINGGPPGRGVPDVAGNADPDTGYNLLVDGQRTVVGGTSAVAPLWAGLFALINEGLGRNVGFANPFLYDTRMQPALRDIQVGNNDTTGRVGAYQAGPGWDPCSGVGSPSNGAGIMSIIAST